MHNAILGAVLGLKTNMKITYNEENSIVVCTDLHDFLQPSCRTKTRDNR